MAATVTVPPLTTTFTPPNSCLSSVYFIDYKIDTYTFSTLVTTVTELTRQHLGPTNAPECFPPGWNPGAYFSPGICPRGYTIASSSVLSIDASVETRATCCPLNYTIIQTQTLDPGRIGSWFSTEPCATATTTQIDTDPTGPVAFDVQYTNAYPVSIRWQAAGSRTSHKSTTTNIMSTSPVMSLAPEKNLSTGLSTGAKIGIGIGTSVGVVLAVLAALLVFCMRRRSGRKNQLQTAELPASTSFVTDLASDQRATRPELDNAPPTELLGRSLAELDSSTRAELATQMETSISK